MTLMIKFVPFIFSLQISMSLQFTGTSCQWSLFCQVLVLYKHAILNLWLYFINLGLFNILQLSGKTTMYLTQLLV